MTAEDVAVGWTTFEDRKSAEEFARKLVADRLAACVQVDSPVRSVYSWEGEVCVEDEVRLWVKTTVSRAENLNEFFDREHPYETPQWIWTVADGASPAYAEWVRDSVANDADA